jgi:hypothetical protein
VIVDDNGIVNRPKRHPENKNECITVSYKMQTPKPTTLSQGTSAFPVPMAHDGAYRGVSSCTASAAARLPSGEPGIA